MIWFIFIVSILDLSQNVLGFQTDYCNRTLCLRWKSKEYVYEQNIACNNSYGYTQNCPSNAEMQIIEGEVKQLILQLHNDHRNKIAGGSVSGYDSAKRMTTMVWDDELAFLAQLNCFRCYYGADQCRNTENYPHVGQNIDIYWSSQGYLQEQEIVTRIFKTWFREHVETDMGVIVSYYNTGRVIGHFTQIVSEKSASVGCALIRWSEPYEDHFHYFMYFVCNYSFTNFDRQPVYTPGEVASGCQTGTNPNYSNLCSVNEFIPPLPSFGTNSMSVTL